MRFDTHELAWAAGLFDGEGYIGVTHTQAKYGKGKAIYPALHLEVSQTDKRVLNRFKSSVQGLGKVMGPYGPYGDGRKTKHRKPRFNFVAGRFETVQAILAMVWKYLSPVKRKQARVTLLAAQRRVAI